MYRLDKSCDLSAFTTADSTRYALGGIRFRPPAKEDVAKVYRDLRQPKLDKTAKPAHTAPAWNQTIKRRSPACSVPVAAGRYGGVPEVTQLTAIEAYKQALGQLRGRMEATNGYLLVSVPTLNGDEFPNTPGAGTEPKEVLIPADAIKKAIASIPKRAGKPVLNSVRLTQHDENSIVLSTTDCERSTDQTCRLLEGRFPRIDEYLKPSDSPDSVVVKFDAKYLEAIAKHARQFSDDTKRELTITLRGPDEPAMFSWRLSDDRTAQAVLMPLVHKK